MQPRLACEGVPDAPRPRAVSPLRQLLFLLGSALVVLAALVSSAALVSNAAAGRVAHTSLLQARHFAAADSDSVATPRPGTLGLDSLVRDSTLADSLATDSLVADSLVADSLRAAGPDTSRAARYLPAFRDRWSASLFTRRQRPLSPRLGAYWSHELELDSTGQAYLARETVGGLSVRYPIRVDYDTYRQERLAYDMDQSWRQLATQRARQRAQQRRGGLGFNIVVPGGQQSAFTTIFGKPEVDLRVNGQADIRAGFDYRKSDQQVAFTGRASQIDPDFKQDLRLGITGTIGDKLRVDVNWDTNNQFDYQNQLKLHYTGYEDEIIQSVEAGNVFLQTPSRLIRGGQSLFGIKSQFQVGGLHLTTVASQQEGQSNELNIEGGSERTEFELRPTDYDENKHFFLGYYFRNRWEDAFSDPRRGIIVAHGFQGIEEIEVWKLQILNSEEENARQVIAMVDLGEPARLLNEADAYNGGKNLNDVGALPSNEIDQYPDDVIAARLREGRTTPKDYLEVEATVPLQPSDYQGGRFKRLRRGTDYEIDEVLGYISLRQGLQDNEGLAVSYRYTANGRTYKVGDFSTETGGSLGGQNEDRLVLKLLRPIALPQPGADRNPPAWYLELRNIYALQGRGISPADFELQVYYEPPGKPPTKTVPRIGGQRTLLQLLGLDRLNEVEAASPDDRFDYLVNYTIDPVNGRLIFPYLQPFGKRIATLIDEGTGGDKQQAKDLYVFDRLYTQKKENARRDTQLDVYRVRVSYKGSVQEFYDLRAYAGLVPGSVRVTSGGTPLSEGADYIVDYQGGTLTITNPAHLTAGRDISITYEQNSFFNLQKKTLLGTRADYSFGENLDLGATVMRLSQKSPIDKFRIGEEPISNTIWGLDGSFQAAPRWLTRTIDALPLVQTKAPSAISLTGEFAQLRPSSSQTVAFDRTRRDLREIGRDFNSDELRGVSYIDDFEGFENTFSLKQPGTWRLSATPAGIRRYPSGFNGSDVDSLRTTWRGMLTWYQLNANIIQELASKAPVYDAQAVARVNIKDVFPNRDTRGEADPTLSTLDVYFNPHERGPYNYTTELRDFLDNPQDVWGGMTQRLPEGYTDFSLKNIEFVEFVFRPFPENANRDAGADAKLYVDLGSISEDIIPDAKLNNEDGLSSESVSPRDLNKWARLPSGGQNNAINVDETTRRTEDLGLDGLASYDPPSYPEAATEQFHFRNFLDALDPNDPDPRYRAEAAKARRDPSGDDYHYFGNDQYFTSSEFFPDGISTFQQRFSRYFPGSELNAYEAQNKLANNTDQRRGNSRYPDSEDLDLNSNVDLVNSYYEYALPLSRDSLSFLGRSDQVNDYVVTEITDDNGTGTGWYQVRIPVRKFTRRVGDIQDFNQIKAIRIWTDGHRVPITMRFASLELVGSQWQKSEQITLERETVADTTNSDTRLTISSINNEENPSTYRSPIGTIVSQTRLANGAVQNSREQAMVLRAENLRPGKQRAIFKTYNQGVDLLKYESLRMFAHLHGRTADGNDIKDRDKVRLFVRLGANERNDYYEYEQPLSPSSETSGNPDALWQTNQMTEGGEVLDLNSLTLRLSALNQLKVARDERGFPADSVFWNDLHDAQLNPALPEFAPPGTRIAIKGTPSLGRINTIVIGLRNPADSTSNALEHILEDVTVWVNELRTAGYDETNGWSALANADIKLADLATVKANFQTQTDGFGSLASSLGEREQNDILNWSVTTDVYLDKFLPERYGWRLPVSVQVQSNTSTPRFSPNRGDIRLDEILAQIEERDDLTPEERDLERQDAIDAAQTRTETRSISTRMQKQGSRSPFLRYTLDGVSFNYSFSDNQASNPSQRLNDTWRWSTTLGYRLNVPSPKTVRPFWFLDPVPVLGILGDLRFNYLPQSVGMTGTASRNFSETQERRRSVVLIDTSATALPERIQYPLQQRQAFSHRRNFNLNYNPLTFLNLTYETSTNQSLSAVGVDTLFNVVRGDTIFAGYDIRRALAEGLIDSSDVELTAFEEDRLRVLPTDEVINRLFAGDNGLHTERYDQRFVSTFRPNFTRTKSLNWLNIQDVSYTATYGWQNGSFGSNTGASVNNQVDVRGGMTLRPQELWRKFAFYRNLEDAQKRALAEAQAERQRRERERAERKRQEAQRRAALENPPEPGDEGFENPPEPGDEPGDEPGAPPADKKGQPAADTTAAEQDGGFKLPLPNPSGLLRRSFLAFTSIRDFTVTYSGSWKANATNVGFLTQDAEGRPIVETDYSLIDAIRGGNTPSVGYRFGFDRRIDPSLRVLDPSLQIKDVLSNNHRIQGRTALAPTPNFQINLTWNMDWDEGSSYTYRENLDGLVDTTFSQSGTNRSSVWAFGASYRSFFQSQLETYRSDFERASDPRTFGDENGDGRVVLTNASASEDFQGAFLSGLGTLGKRGLLAFPMPNWNVTYSGISKWPLIRSLVQSATLRHAYNADYNTNYRTNIGTATGDTTGTFPFDLGGQGTQLIRYTIPRYEVEGVRVNERYQPFIGIDLNFKGRIQTTVAWNKSNAYSLTTNLEVGENKTNELTMTASYQVMGMKLPFFGGKRLNNRISFNLTVSRSRSDDVRYNLTRALQAAVVNPDFTLDDILAGDNRQIVTATTRLRVSPQISYQFSNRVSANFTLSYEKFDSEDSRQPSSTNINGGFNVRVSIAN